MGATTVRRERERERERESFYLRGKPNADALIRHECRMFVCRLSDRVSEQNMQCLMHWQGRSGTVMIRTTRERWLIKERAK